MKSIGGWRVGRLAVVLSVAVLLTAAVMQSAHACGHLVSQLSSGPQFSSPELAGGQCPICMMGQWAAITFLLFLLSLGSVKTAPRQIELRPRAPGARFRLYVRPPPF
jgi:hypothetical protein